MMARGFNVVTCNSYMHKQKAVQKAVQKAAPEGSVQTKAVY